MAVVRDLSRADIVRFLDTEKPLRSKTQRALMVTLLDLTEGDADPPSVSAEDLRKELERRSGGTVRPASFRQQLSRINATLEETKAPFVLATRGGRIVAEASRHWTSTSQMDSVRQALVEHSGAKTRGDLDSYVPPRAMPDHLSVMWSYAWLPKEQQAIQLEIFDLLKAKLAHPPAKYRHLPQIELWRDEERLSLAETGTSQMDEACAGAFLGLLVLSDKYPSSKACMREAAYFLDEEGENKPDKGCVVLRFNCDLGDMDPRFCKRIVFPGGDQGHLLNQWAKGDPDDRNRLIGELARQVFEHADQRHRPPPSSPAPSDRPRGKSRVERYVAEQPQRMRHDDAHSTTPLARAGADGYDVANSASAGDVNGVDIVEHMIGWAASADETRPRITALLGDFGMGKTVTCQLVCRRMVERSKAGESLPTPVYFDLRDIPKPERPEQVTLESLIGDLLRRTGEAAPSATEVIEFIRSRKALVIFDGLDEITNKYSIDVARIIYRQLISIVPADVWNDDAQRRRAAAKNGASVSKPREGPSILLSCRSQYFADFAAERGFLSDADRSGLKLHEDISVYVMLPFNADQIRDYISRNLPADDHERAMNLIQSTYDLGELARRPILLRYIGELVHRLEAEKLAGRTINLSRLYDILVSQTFERDGGKHVIPIRDKKRLLEALALYLHRRQAEDLSNEKLIEWLDAEVGTNFPKLAAALTGEEGLKLSEVFVQDLRNATLLSRPGESGFRFSHTSLREYFLAGALYRAARESGDLECWNVSLPSNETLDFILQRYAVDDPPEKRAFERRFTQLVGADSPLSVRWLAFTIWRKSAETGAGLPRPTTMDCSGFNLTRVELRGSPNAPLPLEDSRWEGAMLDQIVFQDVDLSGANFDGVTAVSAHFVRCRLGGAHFQGAQLNGSVWRDCHLDGNAFADAQLELASARVSTVGGRDWHPQLHPPKDAGCWQVRRRQPYETFGPFAPGTLEGRSILAIGFGRTIRIVDAETSINRRLLVGHADKVRSLAFGFIGGQPVVQSSAEDGTIRLWDLASGNTLSVFDKLGTGMKALGVIGASNQELAGWVDADDNLSLWDVVAGKIAHHGKLSASGLVALTMIDGKAVIAVGGEDGVVVLSDVATGDEIRSIGEASKGRNNSLRSIRFARIEDRLILILSRAISGAELWDVASGKLEAKANPGGYASPVDLTTIDGRVAIISQSSEGYQLWDPASDSMIRTFEAAPGSFALVEFVPSADRLSIVSGSDRDVRLWSWDSSSQPISLPKHPNRVLSLAVAEIDGRLTVASSASDGMIILSDAATGKALRSWKADEDGVHSVAFATLDDKVAVLSGGDDGSVRIWDSLDGTLLAKFGGSARNNWVMSAVCASLDGRPIIAAGDIAKNVTLWDVTSGKKRRTLKGHESWVRTVAFAELNDRLCVISGSDDSTIRVWDAKSGKLIRTLAGHRGPVTAIAIAQVGGRTLLLSGGVDETLLIRDLQTGEILHQMECEGGWINAVSGLEWDNELMILVGQFDQSVRAIRLESFAPRETKHFLHGSDSAITVRHAPDGNEQIVAATPNAWMHFIASYRSGSGGGFSDIDDMPSG
jgi:WD40 repeat protein/uncharacterized protein YjbI with pentapeptide repeats